MALAFGPLPRAPSLAIALPIDSLFILLSEDNVLRDLPSIKHLLPRLSIWGGDLPHPVLSILEKVTSVHAPVNAPYLKVDVSHPFQPASLVPVSSLLYVEAEPILFTFGPVTCEEVSVFVVASTITMPIIHIPVSFILCDVIHFVDIICRTLL